MRLRCTTADYDRGIQLLAAIDRIAALLAQDFSDCPRVLLVTTALGDAHRELSEKREKLGKTVEAE
jgi:hypothetical protein